MLKISSNLFIRCKKRNFSTHLYLELSSNPLYSVQKEKFFDTFILGNVNESSLKVFLFQFLSSKKSSVNEENRVEHWWKGRMGLLLGAKSCTSTREPPARTSSPVLPVDLGSQSTPAPATPNKSWPTVPPQTATAQKCHLAGADCCSDWTTSTRQKLPQRLDLQKLAVLHQVHYLTLIHTGTRHFPALILLLQRRGAFAAGIRRDVVDKGAEQAAVLLLRRRLVIPQRHEALDEILALTEVFRQQAGPEQLDDAFDDIFPSVPENVAVLVGQAEHGLRGQLGLHVLTERDGERRGGFVGVLEGGEFAQCDDDVVEDFLEKWQEKFS